MKTQEQLDTVRFEIDIDTPTTMWYVLDVKGTAACDGRLGSCVGRETP